MTRKLLSYSLRFFSVLLIAAGVLALVLSFFLQDLDHYARQALQHFEKATGYRLAFSDVSLHVGRGAGLRIDDFVLSHTATGREFLRGEHLYIHIRFSPLFKKQIKLRQLLIEKPRIRVYRDADGIWHSFLSALMEPEPAEAGSLFGGYRVSAQAAALNGGVLEIEDELHGTMVRLYDCDISLHRRERETFLLQMKARHDADGSSGIVNYTSEFHRSLFRRRGPDTSQPRLLNARLEFSNLPVQECLSYLPDRFNIPLEGGLLGAALVFELKPGEPLESAGEFVLRGARAVVPGLDGVSLPDAVFSFKAASDTGILNCSEFSVLLEPDVHLTGSARISYADDAEPTVALRLDSGALDVHAIAQRFSEADTQGRFIWLAQAREYIAAADVDVHAMHISAPLGAAFLPEAISLQAQLGFDVSAHTAALPYHLPGSTAGSMELALDNGRLQARGQFSLLPGDSHTFDLDADMSQSGVRLNCTLNSRLNGSSIGSLLHGLTVGTAPAAELYEGVLSVQTSLQADGDVRIAADINATDAAYSIAGSIGKPRGMANTIRLEYDSRTKSGMQLPFEFRLDGSLSTAGRVLLVDGFAIEGRFAANGLNVSGLDFTFLPTGLSLAGSLSGMGDFAFPAQQPNVRPVTGTLELRDIALLAQPGEQPLLEASAVLDFFSGVLPISVSAGRVTAGDTRGAFSGRLVSAVPPVGMFTVPMEYYDIDDFIDIMFDIVGRARDSYDAAPVRDDETGGMFAQMDIRVDLSSEQTRYLDWHFGPGTCYFTVKDKRLLWDAIDVTAGDGYAQGSVLYDLSMPDSYGLEFVIGRSDVDIAWAIPPFSEDQAMTGRLFLKSRFGSRFTTSREVLENMEGVFDVVVKDGKIKRLTLVSNILNALNLARLFTLRMPEFSAGGMPFDTMTGRVVLKDKQLSTDDFLLVCPSMNFSAAGAVDLRSDMLDLLIGVQVFRVVGRVLGSIPYFGKKLTGTNKTLTLTYFRARGSFADPRVRPVPMKIVDNAILNVFKTVRDVPRDLMYLPMGMIRRFVGQENDNETGP
jgi:hypothetical protein